MSQTITKLIYFIKNNNPLHHFIIQTTKSSATLWASGRRFTNSFQNRFMQCVWFVKLGFLLSLLNFLLIFLIQSINTCNFNNFIISRLLHDPATIQNNFTNIKQFDQFSINLIILFSFSSSYCILKQFIVSLSLYIQMFFSLFFVAV